jgi:hypothetical protein
VGTLEAFPRNRIVFRWDMIADLVLADVVDEAAGSGVGGSLYFVEAVVEGKHRCSLGTAVGAEERSGHSSAVRSQVKPEVEGNRVRIEVEESRATIVGEGSQATLVEEVERLLLCELGASRDRLWEERTVVPAIRGCCSKSQCILPVQRDS